MSAKPTSSQFLPCQDANAVTLASVRFTASAVRELLRDSGKISAETAEAFAEDEFEKF